MSLKFIDIFEKEINNIKKDKNNLSIVLVGSSKNIDFRKDVSNISDIDLFIFTKSQSKDQIRINKVINDIEFDLNYVSKQGCENFIKNKVLFFLDINDGKILYDTDDYGKHILEKCKKYYEIGPDILSKEIKNSKILNISSEIKKLKNKDDFEKFEYDFLVNLNLKNLIELYYINKDRWIPKDKKLIKSIKKDDRNIYSLLKELGNNDNEYEILEKILNYIINID